MATIPIVPMSPDLVVLSMLERARAALYHDQPMVGRAFVDDAIHRLEAAKAAQDAVLDEWAATREPVSRTSIDLRAG